MSAIHASRKWLTLFLIAGYGILGAVVFMAFYHGAPHWPLLILVPPLFGLLLLSYTFAARIPELSINEGSIVVHGGAFLRSIKIPVDAVRSIRVAKFWISTDYFRYLEVCLNRQVPEADTISNRITRRWISRWARVWGGYSPPPEPYLLFPISPLQRGDDDVAAIVNAANQQSRTGAAPNSGPAASVDNSSAPGGPPSVS